MTILGASVTNIIVWALFGLIVGFVVHLLDPGDVKGGIFSTMLLGILGSIFGGFLSLLIFGRAVIGFTFAGFATAVIGSLILALISRFIFRDNQHIKTSVSKLQH